MEESENSHAINTENIENKNLSEEDSHSIQVTEQNKRSKSHLILG